MAKVSRQERREKKRQGKTLGAFPVLSAVKPKQGYRFHSDYFVIDGTRVGCVLSLFHLNGAEDRFPPFWGTQMTPRDLPDGVTVIRFEQVERQTDAWVDQKQGKAEHISNLDQKEQSKASQSKKLKMSKTARDLATIAEELNRGATYLSNHIRLLIKAPDLETLDYTVSRIRAQYSDWFQTLRVGVYHGDQRRELSDLFAGNDKKLGKAFGFTSSEYAGAYSLVSRGLTDPGGEYVGVMIGDINSSAILFDIDRYRHHVVVAATQKARSPGVDLHGERASAMWGSKLSQACLLNGGRVVHLILDGTSLDHLGPAFPALTSVVRLNKGDLNMFEMFGKRQDIHNIFPAQLQKLVLMAEHAYTPTEDDRSVIRGSMKEIVTRFYIDNRMWAENAARNIQHIRAIGIPHKEVPKLEMFVSYLEQAYAALVNAASKDNEVLHAYSVLRTAFRDMLSANGDLFNVTTSDSIDRASSSQRVIYDFSGLRMRGQNLAMAQFVNVLGYAVGSLGEGDLVLIHGAERVSESVKEYTKEQLDILADRGARVGFLYNKIEPMLADKSFSSFDRADYTILGGMTDTGVVDYQAALGQEMPVDLVKSIVTRDPHVYYIHRGFDNVVFTADLSLGLAKGVRRL